MKRVVFEKMFLGCVLNGIEKTVLDVQITKWERLQNPQREDRGLNKCNNKGDEEVSTDRSTVTDQNQPRCMGNEQRKGERAPGPLIDFSVCRVQSLKQQHRHHQ